MQTNFQFWKKNAGDSLQFGEKRGNKTLIQPKPKGLFFIDSTSISSAFFGFIESLIRLF